MIVTLLQVCDGVVDCLNLEDETQCDLMGGFDGEYEFSGGDFGQSAVGIGDCDSGETKCDPSDHDSECVPMYKFCDRKKDCPNGEDEVIERCVALANH